MKQSFRWGRATGWLRETTLWRRLASQGGYTLVEMVVLMGIMAVLSGLVVANTKVGDKRQQLRDAANQFVSAAKHAESMAAASEVVEDPTASATNPLKKASRKAYGICLSSSATAACQRTGSSLPNYQLYVRNTSGTSDLAATTGAILVKNYPLPPNVRFSTAAANRLQWIDYVPPQPSMTANGKNVPVSIQLSSSKDAAYLQTVAARPSAGVIYVK